MHLIIMAWSWAQDLRQYKQITDNKKVMQLVPGIPDSTRIHYIA